MVKGLVGPQGWQQVARKMCRTRYIGVCWIGRRNPMADISAFANRLRKNARHWSKWARRNDISCYRLYDRDVPEFPFVIDIYGDQLHLQEVDTGWQIGDDDYITWLATVSAAAAEVLQLPDEAIHLKQRRRQKGLEQYEKAGEQGEEFVVEEGGLKFGINLDQYLDVGLFLDHRNTRAMVRAEAAGKRFLNLFAYTGSFTVYAAHGGATSSVTVDMSNTYQAWTQRNLELNGLAGPQHRRSAPTCSAIWKMRKTAGERFDLIVMDRRRSPIPAKCGGAGRAARPRVAGCAMHDPAGTGRYAVFLQQPAFIRIGRIFDEIHRVEEIGHLTVPGRLSQQENPSLLENQAFIKFIQIFCI